MQEKKIKNNRGLFFLVRQIALGLMDAVLILVVFLIGFFIYLYIQTPTPDLKNQKIDQTTVLYDRTGEHVLYEIYGEENRKIITHAEIPNVVRMATIAADSIVSRIENEGAYRIKIETPVDLVIGETSKQLSKGK